MNILVAGASGATGRLLVTELLKAGHKVTVVVRSAEKFSELINNPENLKVIEASLLNLSGEEMQELVKECDAIASCLGHNLSWKGIFGPPRRLVRDATLRLCEAIKVTNSDKPVRFVLMNTAGNRNRDLDEPISFGQKVVIGLLRLLLPPHVDNEEAADFLRLSVGQNDPAIEWSAVRPDNLIDEDKVSEYEAYPSPIRSAIFNAGQTSRINVAHFMASLSTDQELWNQWKGKMPVIYNKN